MNLSIAADPPVVDLGSFNKTPHARFAALREQSSIVQYAPKQYLVIGGEAVVSLLDDPRARQIERPESVAFSQVPDGIMSRFMSDIFVVSNDQAHCDQRQLFARSFTRPVMQGVRPVMRAVADRLVNDLPRRQVFDFVDQMAARFQTVMIATILGLPDDDIARVAPIVRDVAPAFTPDYPQASHEKIEQASQLLCDYVRHQLTSRQDAPRDDILTTLVADWSATQAISFESLVFQVSGIIAAGTKTLCHALTMLVVSLLRRPLTWAAVRSDHQLIPGAVAESLRFEPPVASVPRLATAPIHIDGFTLPAGAFLRLSIMSATRDPALYANPDRFNIRRTDHSQLHLGFGLGSHRCLGDALAMIALEESLAALLDAASTIELVSPPRLGGLVGVRQITPMHLYIP